MCAHVKRHLSRVVVATANFAAFHLGTETEEVGCSSSSYYWQHERNSSFQSVGAAISFTKPCGILHTRSRKGLIFTLVGIYGTRLTSSSSSSPHLISGRSDGGKDIHSYV